jgi:phosphoribosyl 1,2-cyclic phosphodiesterase
MNAKIWGCRGSLATPGAETVRYGGNTSCVEVRSATGSLIVLDAGTGIRPLGDSLAPDTPAEIDLLLTHIHLDHVEGLGFFAPFFDPACRVRIWGPQSGPLPLREQIAAYLSPPFFPVPFDRFPARVEVTEIWDEEWDIDGIRVRSCPLAHPGRTVGYRLEENGRSLAYIPDNELGLRAESGASIALRADILLHDAQYTKGEYASRVGWGHSTLEDFAAYVEAAQPGRAVMFHHDPAHADDQLERMLAKVRALTDGIPIELAHEGLELAFEDDNDLGSPS